MTPPTVLSPCEGFAALAAVVRDPQWAVGLAAWAPRVFEALPSAWRLVAQLAVANADDLTFCGWSVVFGDRATIRVLATRAGLRCTAQGARDVQRVAIRVCGPVLDIVVADGRALLEAAAFALGAADDARTAQQADDAATLAAWRDDAHAA
jgi:hypothetical protein